MASKQSDEVAKRIMAIVQNAKEKSGEEGILVTIKNDEILSLWKGQRLSARRELDLAESLANQGAHFTKDRDGIGVYSAPNFLVIPFKEAISSCEDDDE